MYEIIRIVNKLKPKYIFWENVENLLSNGKRGHIYNFKKYKNTMQKLGYNCYYQVLNSEDYGVPQSRNRVFTLCIRQDIDDLQFTFPLKQKLKRKYIELLEENYTDYNINIILKENHLRRLKNHETYSTDYGFGGKIIENDDVFPTLLACYGSASGNGGAIKCKEGYRRLTPRECWRLMDFTDIEYEKAKAVCADTPLTNQAGNSIVVGVLKEVICCLFYRQYKQNIIINNLVRILSNNGIEKIEIIEKKKVILEVNGKSSLYLDGKGTYFTVKLENYDDLELKNIFNQKCVKNSKSKKLSSNVDVDDWVFKVRDNCIKFIEAINYEFSRNGFATQTVKLDMEYLLRFFNREGKSDLKTKQLKQYLEILKNITIGFYSTEDGQALGEYINMKLCNVEETKIIKDDIYFTFSDELYDQLKNNGTYVYMPKEALTDRNTDLMFKAIVEHIIEFKGTEEENIIPVTKLYDYLGLPEYKEGEKHFGRIILDPFNKALDNIIYMNWKYDKQHNGRYKKWIDANIIIDWKMSPFIPNVDEEAYSKLE